MTTSQRRHLPMAYSPLPSGLSVLTASHIIQTYHPSPTDIPPPSYTPPPPPAYNHPARPPPSYRSRPPSHPGESPLPDSAPTFTSTKPLKPHQINQRGLRRPQRQIDDDFGDRRSPKRKIITLLGMALVMFTIAIGAFWFEVVHAKAASRTDHH